MPGFRYVVYGVTRGYVSTHRTKRAALRSLAEDAWACMRAGNPADALVYFWRGSWTPAGAVVEAVAAPEATP